MDRKKGSSTLHQCLSGDAKQILREIIRGFASELVSESCRRIWIELMIRLKPRMIPQLPIYAELFSQTPCELL